MESDQDIRAKALLDQLNEIDVRILRFTGRTLSRADRILGLLLFGVFSIILALSASTFERLGIGLALPVSALLAVSLTAGPLLRRFRRRKLERERERVLVLYEEIDRRLTPSQGDSEGGRGVS